MQLFKALANLADSENFSGKRITNCHFSLGWTELNFKPKPKPNPDNHCRLSKLSLAKRSKLFGQLLTSLCRVSSVHHPRRVVAAEIVQRFRYCFWRTSVAATSSGCGSCCSCSYSTLWLFAISFYSAHFIMTGACEAAHTFFIIMSAYQHVANILQDHRLCQCLSLCPSASLPLSLFLHFSLLLALLPSLLLRNQVEPSQALKCAFRAARLGASLHSSLIVWIMPTSAAGKTHKAALWC